MKAKRINVVLGCISAIVVAAASIIVGVVLWSNLTEHPALRACGIVGVVGGCAIAGLLALLSCRARRIRGPVIVAVCVVIFLIAPALSMFAGAITYSRFGFTVYGIIPLPVLDIKIGPSHVLGFRDKGHEITLSEVEPLLSDEVELIIVGTGWYEVAQVDPALANLKSHRVEVLRTPEAFALFNRLSKQGAKIILIAHTTC